MLDEYPTEGAAKNMRTYVTARSRNGILYLVRDDGYPIDSGIED